MGYFTRKLELVPNILWMCVVTLIPSFINFKHSSWFLKCLKLIFCTYLRRPKSNARYDMRYVIFRAFIWAICLKELSRIVDMADMTNLTSFFSVSFYFWLALYFHSNDKYCQNYLLNIFSVRNYFVTNLFIPYPSHSNLALIKWYKYNIDKIFG